MRPVLARRSIPASSRAAATPPALSLSLPDTSTHGAVDGGDDCFDLPTVAVAHDRNGDVPMTRRADVRPPSKARRKPPSRPCLCMCAAFVPATGAVQSARSAASVLERSPRLPSCCRFDELPAPSAPSPTAPSLWLGRLQPRPGCLVGDAPAPELYLGRDSARRRSVPGVYREAALKPYSLLSATEVGGVLTATGASRTACRSITAGPGSRRRRQRGDGARDSIGSLVPAWADHPSSRTANVRGRRRHPRAAQLMGVRPLVHRTGTRHAPSAGAVSGSERRRWSNGGIEGGHGGWEMAVGGRARRWCRASVPGWEVARDQGRVGAVCFWRPGTAS